MTFSLCVPGTLQPPVDRVLEGKGH